MGGVPSSRSGNSESPDQIEFTIGHELKHYVMGDNWTALAYVAGFLLVGFWLTDRVGRAAIHRFSGAGASPNFPTRRHFR